MPGTNPARRLPRLPITGPLAGFDVVDTLGRGGMATVYWVRERTTGRELALKLCDPQRSATRLERLAREAQITASLNHSGILRVHGAGALGQQGYILCELVEGARSLDALFADLPLRGRVELIRDAARALGHAHSQGIVHRDVKPDNLLVGADGRLRVADFGLASALEVERLTRSGAVLGTPHYMAPEQVSAQRSEMGSHTDVWALGVILYQALTGEQPFDGGSVVELAAQITTRDPEPPRRRNADAPAGLEAVCLKALSKAPLERYSNGDAFAQDLDRWLEGQEVEASGVRLRLGKKGRKTLLLLVPLALAAGVVAFALAFETRAPKLRLADDPKDTASPETPEYAPGPGGADVASPVADPHPMRSDEEWYADDMRHLEGFMREPVILHQVKIGDPTMVGAIATGYFTGEGGTGGRDVPRAMRWLRRAAAGGNVSCMGRLGEIMLEDDLVGGAPRDLEGALSWLQAAAEHGGVGSLRRLGAFYRQSEGERHDRARGIELLGRAVEGGDHGAREVLGEALQRGTHAEVRRAVQLFSDCGGENRARCHKLLGADQGAFTRAVKASARAFIRARTRTLAVA